MKIILLAVSLMLAANPALADSNRLYAYLGGAAGTANGTFDFPGLPTVDDDDVSYDFFGGVSFNRFVAVEGGITDFGSYSDNFPGFNLSSETGFTSRYLAAVGKLPLNSLLSVYGKVGIAFWEVEQVFRNAIGAAFDDDSGNDVYYAVGLRYDLDDYLALLGEYRQLSVGAELFNTDTDLDVKSFAIGLALAF